MTCGQNTLGRTWRRRDEQNGLLRSARVPLTQGAYAHYQSPEFLVTFPLPYEKTQQKTD
jgi:hypothetical protein